jgi:hypothetical protein
VTRGGAAATLRAGCGDDGRDYVSRRRWHEESFEGALRMRAAGRVGGAAPGCTRRTRPWLARRERAETASPSLCMWRRRAEARGELRHHILPSQGPGFAKPSERPRLSSAPRAAIKPCRASRAEGTGAGAGAGRSLGALSTNRVNCALKGYDGPRGS